MHVNGTNGHNGTTLTSSSHNIPEEQEIDFIKLLNLLLLNKWKIVVFTLVSGADTFILTQIMTPIYSSSGTIIISESKNRYSYAGSDLSNLLTTTYGIGVGSTIANELQILQSVTLSYELAERIMKVGIAENAEQFPILMRSYPENPTFTTIDTVAMRFRGNISFRKVDPEADLVQITFESPSPHEAFTIVNLTMDTYSSLSTEQNRKMAVEALTFLSNERIKIQSNLALAEDSLRMFMNKSQLVAIDPQASQLITSIAQIEKDRKTAEVSLFAIEASIQEYQQQLDEIKPGLANQYSEAIGPIIERYQFALSELETEKLLYEIKNPGIDGNNPEIIRLTNQINQIKAQIGTVTDYLLSNGSTLYLSFASRGDGAVLSRISQISERLIELQIDQAQFETQIQVLKDYYNELDTSFEELPDNMIELVKHQRNVKINEELFMMIERQYQEMSLWEKTQFGLGRPLDYAMLPSSPISPKKKIIIFIGLFLGGVFGVGFVFIRDIVNDKINSTDTLKDFNLPLLGTIPDFSIMDGLDSTERQFIDNKSVSNQIITFLDHISPISEAYRRLRINVIYANPDKQYKVMMVTSATKGEGKSTVAANLAITFSEAEKSVLLIDLDLRRPTQHKIFGENREPGLTDTLFETVKLSSIVRNTVAPNVDLLTVGKKTPEPATVLDSKRLKQLIDRLKDRYDHIILDTAPYGIISDSASLLRLVDGIVVVSRFNVTTKRELSYTLEGLQHLNADILGLVLNAFNPEKSTDYYTNYSYYKRTYYSDYYKEQT